MQGTPTKADGQGITVAPNTLVVYRRNGRGPIVGRAHAYTGQGSPSGAHVASISFCALKLALRAHIPDPEQCERIAKDVFENAVKLQRSGAATRVIVERRREKHLEDAVMSLSVSSVPVQSAATAKTLPSTSMRSKQAAP